MGGVALGSQNVSVREEKNEPEREAVGAPRPALASRLRRWLCSGACQCPSGAFAAWLDRDSGALAFEYPEITGYALTYFSWRRDALPQERLAAQLAANWLRARIDAGKLHARDGWDGEAVYHFDLGIIAHGLLMFGRTRGDEACVATGLRLTALLQAAIAQDGALGPLSSQTRGRSTRRAWSTDGFSHLTKVAQCLLLADSLGQQGALSAARTLVDRCRQLQGDGARIPTEPGNHTSLHPLLYACEGLWMWGTAAADADALARARRALAWVFSHQLANGGFPGRVAADSTVVSAEQTDVTAQAVRMALLLQEPGVGVDRALARLAVLTDTGSSSGGLLYRPDLPHVNSWSTLFASQAVQLSSAGIEGFGWEHLV